MDRARRRIDDLMVNSRALAGSWHLLAWVGSLGFGLGLFLLIAANLRLEYHSTRDIVATPAVVAYPEMRDLWLYLAALAVIPLAALLAYLAWLFLVARCRLAGPRQGRYGLVLLTLALLACWSLVALYPPARLAAPLVAGLVVTAAAWPWLRRVPQRRLPAQVPGLALQGAVALLGAGLGVALLTSPLAPRSPALPAAWIVIPALSLWGLWLAAAYLLARAWQQAWQTVAQSLALGCLPLSALFVGDVLWWEVWQGGVRLVHSGAVWSHGLLMTLAVAGAIAVTAWALARQRRASPPDARLFWRWFWLLAVPLLLYGCVYDPNVHGPLDLFHEGERLAPAQALLAGELPYRDVVFVHGFGRDPGVALAAFGLFGPSVESLRLLEQLLAPLSLLASYYLLLAWVGGGWALAYYLLALAGVWPIFYDWRIVACVAACGCLVLYIRRRHLAWAMAAGISTLVALAVAFDLGLVALLAGLAFCLAFSLAHQQAVGPRLLLAYLVPLLVGLGGVWLYASWRGIWAELVSWHVQILAVYRDWNGMPFPVPASFGRAWEFYFSPLASIVAIAGLLGSLVSRRWPAAAWPALILLVANVLLFNRGIVGGSESGTAFITAAHFSPLLLLVLGAWPAVRKPAGAILVLVVAIILVVPPPTTPLTRRSTLDWIAGLPAKNRIEVPGGWVRSDLERVGAIYLPAEQEQALQQIVSYVDGRSFWDLTDHGALFFLANATSPTRFYATHHVITRENQLEVIEDLEREQPRLVLYRSGTGWDSIAGVDRTLRSFLVSEYLLQHYHLAGQAGGFTVLEWGAPAARNDGLAFRVDLGAVPFLWGRDRRVTLEERGLEAREAWRAQDGSLQRWQPGAGLRPIEVNREGWHLRCLDSDTYLAIEGLELDPGKLTYAALRMGLAGQGAGRVRGQMWWAASGQAFAEERSLLFDLVTDGQEHLYLLRLASFPGWAWSAPIERLRLDLVGCDGADATVDAVELMHVQEW